MTMKTARGTVTSTSRNGKAFKLDMFDDVWFSVFDLSQISDNFGRGASVEFNYTVKPGPRGDYYNVKNRVNVLNPGPEASAEAGSTGVADARSGRGMEFGKANLNRDRCIARQNACNVMSALLANNVVLDPAHVEMDDVERLAHLVLKGAHIIESYTMGDIDKEEAEAKMADMETLPDSPAVSETSSLPESLDNL